VSGVLFVHHVSSNTRENLSPMLPMLPISYQLARLLHEERISAAKRPRPEWMSAAASVARPRRDAAATRHVRSAVAQILRRLAERVEPAPAASASASN
jgi:hypothetical protein